MLRRLHIRRGVAGMALGVVLALAVMPPALAFYRCTVAGTAHAKPCCGGSAQADDAATLVRECCALVTVAVERAPAESSPRASAAAPAILVGDLAPSDEGSAIAARTLDGPRIDLRRRIHAQACSLLI